MKLVDKAFIQNYLNLTLTGIKLKSFARIIFLEALAAVLALISVCFFGLLIQLLLDQSTFRNSNFTSMFEKLSTTFRVDGLQHFELIILISFISMFVALSALLLEFASLKFIRKTARKAYSKSLTNHIIAFRDSPEPLSLTNKSLSYFRSSFTIDAHITFNAFEAILKCFRPITYIVVFSIAVIILQPIAMLIIFLFIAVCVPFSASLNRQTLSSAKGVLGEQRKAVYAELNRFIDEIDLNKNHAVDSSEIFFSSKFNSMLDSFDSWKLSSDSSNYTLQTLKVIGVHLAIISIGLAAYFNKSFKIISFVLLALIILKLLLSIINLLTRLTVLSRLFPVVNRYLTVVKEVSSTRDLKEFQSNKTSDVKLQENIWFGIAGSHPIRKSQMGLLTKQLNKNHSNFDLTRLTNQNYGTIGDHTLHELDFSVVLNQFIEEAEGETSTNFRQFLFKMKLIDDNGIIDNIAPIDPSFAWKRAIPEIRVMLNFMVLIYDPSIDYIICQPASVDHLKNILDTNKFIYKKPILTFDKNIKPNVKQPYNMVLVLPKAPQEEFELLN